MFMRDLQASLLRRWYLSLAGLLLTAGLCFGTALAFPPTYEAKASIVLLPPKTAMEGGSNPYLSLGGLSQVVDVLTRSLNSQVAVEASAKLEPTATYLVAPDYATSGPILVITADAKTTKATLGALKIVSAMVPTTLTSLQSALGIADNARITSAVLASDTDPSPVRKTQIRALIAAAAVGLILVALLIAAIDSLLLRRGRTGRVRSPDGTDSAKLAGAGHTAGSLTGTPVVRRQLSTAIAPTDDQAQPDQPPAAAGPPARTAPPPEAKPLTPGPSPVRAEADPMAPTSNKRHRRLTPRRLPPTPGQQVEDGAESSTSGPPNRAGLEASPDVPGHPMARTRLSPGNRR